MTEINDDSLCLLQDEGDIAHQVSEASQVVDGDTYVVRPRAKS